jgi:hypothetical protein
MAGRLRDDHIRFVLSLEAKGVDSELYKLSSATEKLSKETEFLKRRLNESENSYAAAEAKIKSYTTANMLGTKAHKKALEDLARAKSQIEEYSKKIKENTEQIAQNNTRSEELIQTLRIEDMTMNQLKNAAKDLEKQLNNTSKSTDPEVYAELEKQLTEVRQRMRELRTGSESVQTTMGQLQETNKAVDKSFFSLSKGGLSVFIGNMMTKAVGVMKEYIAKGIEWVKTGVDMAASAEGVIRAFNRFNDKKLLGNLREASSGVLSDLDLMKKALQAKELHFPIEHMATLLDYAGRQAVDLDRDINTVIDSLIHGIGNESTRVLNRYGIDMNRVRQEVKKTGDFTSAVMKIMTEEIEKQGKVALTASDKAAVSAAKWENAQLKLGQKLLFVKNIWTAFSGESADTFNNIIDKYLPLVLTGTENMINRLIDLYNNTKVVRVYVQYMIAAWKTFFDLFKHNIKYSIELFKAFIDIVETGFNFDPKGMFDAFNNFNKKVRETAKGTFVDIKKNFQEAFDSMDVKLDHVEFKEYIEAVGNYAGATKKTLREVTGESLKQKKELNLILEGLETAHQKKMGDIKQQYLKGDIKSEAEYNRKLYSQEQAYYLLREEALEDYLKKTTDKELKSDIVNQISELQGKRLDKEIAYRKELEKILLDANPLGKERQEYEERLEAVGLFEAAMLREKGESGEALEKLTEDQLKALELLEKQHQDNIKKIKEAGAAQAKKDAEARFLEGDGTDENPGFKKRKEEMQLELNDLMAQSAANPKVFDAEMAVHVQKLKMINEEIEARRAAGLETTKQVEQLGKIEAGMTSTISKELQKRNAQFEKYGNSVGQAMGKVITGQENALRAFGDASIDIVFDVLSKIIEAELIKVMASSTSAIMRATAEAMATPQSALTFGASGFATAAILTGAITAATVAAKAALKGLLGKKKGSSSSGSSDSKSSGSITVKKDGFAEGGFHEGYTGSGAKYDVKGVFPDGQPYHAGEYIIPKEELKVPWINNLVRKVDATRLKRTGRNPLPEGFAEGGYHDVGMNPGTSGMFGSGMVEQEMLELLRYLKENGIDARTYFGDTEYQARLNRLHEENSQFSKKQ